VYGKTKGLVARRKALAAMTLQIDDSSESSDCDSDDGNGDHHNDKENLCPRTRKDGSPKKVIKGLLGKPSSSAISVSDSDSDSVEEVIIPSMGRKKRLPAAVVTQVPSRQDVVREDKELDEIVSLIEKKLGLAKRPEVKKEQAKATKDLKSEETLLLELCAQSCPEEFSAYLSHLEQESKSSTWNKIGEASYSEVYGVSSARSVIKIIPLVTPRVVRNDSMPEQSLIRDVHREIQLSKSLSRVDDGFVKFYR
jgi:hypothetical protein